MPDLNGKYILFEDAMWAQEAYEKLMGEIWQLREEVNYFHKVLKEKENAEENKTKYDFTFKDVDRFYCHEFTVDCLNAGGIEIPMYSKTFGVWPFRFQRELYLADGIIAKTKEIYRFEG